MEPKEWISIAAIFLSPIFAVLIGQFLQWRKEKSDRRYNSKLSVFAAILGLRHAKEGSDVFISAINQIPIVFHDNDKVLNSLGSFVKSHKDTVSPSQKVTDEMKSHLNDLILEIARDLGYSNLDNSKIDSFYGPDHSWYNRQAQLVHSLIYYHKNIDEAIDLSRKDNSENQKHQG